MNLLGKKLKLKPRKNWLSEAYCLRLMTTLYVIIAVFSVASGILTHSTALILDGALSIFDVISIFATLLVAKLLASPHSYPYHFGYFKLEPLLVAVQAFIMIVTCLVSVLHSLKDLYHHTSFIRNFDWGFSYIIFSLVISSIIYVYCILTRKKHPSPLLDFQVLNWRYSILLASGLLIGFIIAYILENSPHPHLNGLATYVDPIMTCTVVAFIIKQVYFLFFENFNDLIDKQPKYHSQLEGTITSIVIECARSLNLEIQIKYFKSRRAGRAHFFAIGYTTTSTVPFHTIILLHDTVETMVQKRFEHYHVFLTPSS